MKMIVILLIMFVVILLVLLPNVLGDSWSGYVLDVNNIGIDAVNVSIYKSTGQKDFLNFTLTDANGFFQIFFSAASTFLNSSKDGYVTDISQDLPNINDDRTLPFNITLEEALPGSIAGGITNSSGGGIENVSVSAIQGDSTINSTLTSSNGNYSISLIDGTYTVKVNASNYISQNVTNVVVLPNLTTTQDFVLNFETTPPGISDISATLITSSEAVIIWQTDESANSSVDYYANGGFVLNSGSATLITSHMVRLSSLSSSTLYFYNVSSCDFVGNCNVSTLNNFTTLSASTPTESGGGGGGGGSSGSGSVTTVEEEIKEVNKTEGIPEQLFDISLDLEDFVIQDISELVAIATFESFGTEPTPVTLLFTILNKDGEEVHSEEHAIIVETEEVFRRRFADVDLDLPKGKYTFILTTLYHVTVVDEFRHEFEITGKKMNWSLIIGIISILVIVSVAYLLIKLRKNRNKRKGGGK